MFAYFHMFITLAHSLLPLSHNLPAIPFYTLIPFSLLVTG